MTEDRADKDAEFMAYLDRHKWRFGGHSPEPNDRLICIAVGPDGKPCGRAVNRTGVRHNPKPYGRAMKYRRRPRA